MSEQGNVLELSDQTFDQTVAQGVTLVDFWAPWCGPCRMLAPVLHELADEAGPGVRIAKVNVDECPQLAARFRVQAIPLVVVLRDGQEVARLVGLQSKAALAKALALAA